MDIIVVLTRQRPYWQMITDVSGSLAASIFTVVQVTQKKLPIFTEYLHKGVIVIKRALKTFNSYLFCSHTHTHSTLMRAPDPH
jgi:hypothetical protein